jgi:hypothetical protein
MGGLAGQSIDEPLIRIKNFIMGGLRRSLTVTYSDAYKTCLVGSDFLMQARHVYFDFDQGYVELNRRPDYPVYLPFKRYQNLIVVPVKIGGDTYDFIWDTGAQMSFVDPLVAQKYPTIFRDTKASVSATDAVGVDVNHMQVYEASSLDIGRIGFDGAELVEMPATFPFKETKVSGILGMNIIRRLHWHFDLQSGLADIYYYR